MSQQFKITRLEETIGGKVISLETGLMARQASGAVVIRMGDTVLLSAAVCAKEPKPGALDFTPITVNYKERTYAAGKYPGGFFKREGRPSTKEILASRLTDRSVRPLFPEGFNHEVTVTAMVLSSDKLNDADVLSITASSAALMISCTPFNGPVAAVRVGRVDGKYIVNPTLEEREKSDLELVISGTLEGILMVEGGGKEIPDEVILQTLELAKVEIDKLCNLQLKLREQVGIEKLKFTPAALEQEVAQAIGQSNVREEIKGLLRKFMKKHELENAVKEIKTRFNDQFKEKYPETAGYAVSTLIEGIMYEESRAMVLNDRVRADGRKTDQIRPLDSRVGIMPRTHGSTLFTRGETQTLAVCTLGTPEDMQLVEGLEGSYKERFMLHYNFPGFSTGECKRDASPGRREIGHGELARRALKPMMPTEDEFPYTIRIVSDIMESNGSSSMASVCGGCLSLLDAGVPMKASVAGIAMGLITDGSRHAVLSDIMGLEDHLGDMDFKVTGTRKGITAFQMDVKLATGIRLEILKEAIAQAGRGRMHLLDHMDSVLPAPRADISRHAPRLFKTYVPQDKIGALIGPGGKNVRRIIEETGADIQIEDDGSVFISAIEAEKAEAARTMVEYYGKEVEVGQVYKGRIVSIQPFGAFVEIIPGKEGLLHISEIENRRIQRVEDVLKMGEEVEVKVVEMDNNGKIRLSRKALLQGGANAKPAHHTNKN
ncbi:MAG: polyribonucleotide nucleotidyltransferase [Elusimicrobia bacterium]|nr:polyribonucleotide nucleotidyltransferase [Elusimicrobiota bacterium]